MRSLQRLCDHAGLELAPFQRAIAREFHSNRRELVVLLPRGNGKTTLMAALALHHLTSVQGAAVYCAAASREQARILFEAAAAFARRLDSPHIVIRHLELRWCPDPTEPKVFTRHMRVLAADAPRLHGLDPTLAIIDELHAHPSDDLYLALRTAMLKRPRSKLVTISTAGHDANGPLGKLRTRALAQPTVTRRRALTRAIGDSLAMLEWAVPENADADDMTAVKGANPASWITEADLHEQRQAVPNTAFRRYHCNQWVEGENAWLPPGAWQRCTAEFSIDCGDDIWIGVDIGGTRAASAVVWVTEDLRVGSTIYQGDAAVLDCLAKVRELGDDYTVREVAFDPWRFRHAALELEEEGVPVVQFDQTTARMVPASERLHAAVVEGRLKHSGDPQLARHVMSAVARDTGRGWRLDKRARTSQVDAVVALAMAVERAEHRQPAAQLVGWI